MPQSNKGRGVPILKILVCMKQVPQKDAPLKLNESRARGSAKTFPTKSTSRMPMRWKRRCASAKSTRAKSSSSPAARRGRSRCCARRWPRARTARFIWKTTSLSGSTPSTPRKAFAAAIKDEQFDLIFTGLQSDDYGYAQTGVILAELLGWPHATIIMQIEKTDSGIRVKRELEAGYFQFVDMPTPAVLTIQSGINKLRYATLIGIKQAKNKPLRKVALAEVQSAHRRESAEDRAALRPAEDEEDGAHRRLSRRNCEEAGGQAAERIAGAVSVARTHSSVGRARFERLPRRVQQ